MGFWSELRQSVIAEEARTQLPKMLGTRIIWLLLAVAGILGGISTITAGLARLASEIAQGTVLLSDNGVPHWQICVGMITAGLAVFSPGLHALKRGPFARPDDPPGGAPPNSPGERALRGRAGRPIAAIPPKPENAP